MSDPLIRELDYYVILEPGKSEEIISVKQTVAWLEHWLNKLIQLNALPHDLQQENNVNSAAERLLETACELEIKPGFSIKWFAVRLDPPKM